MNDFRDSWPPTPDSSRATSLYQATTAIDELTLALTNHTRVPSPEPEPFLTCCCSRDDCENTKGWLTFKAKLESRLVLSAEVGQALLSRHEAYVRQQESRSGTIRSHDTEVDPPTDGIDVDSRVAELIKQNAVLEKRLTQALVDGEVMDNSHKHALQELEETRSSVSRLAAHHARTVGLDARLMAVMREKDDLQQERDSEAQRAKLAEGRISALKERTTKLQTEVRRLQHDLESRRQHRLELSEEILQDARLRLETFQNYNPGPNTAEQENEVMKVLESLVADNENLKRDNAELQNLLTEAREDVRTLTEEVEEHRADGTPHSRDIFSGSIASSYTDEKALPVGKSPVRHSFEPLTPETDHGRRVLPPVDPPIPPELQKPSARHQASLGHHRCNPSSLNLSPELIVNLQNNGSRSYPKSPRRSLLLLSESKGVQTESESVTGRHSPMIHPHSHGDHLSVSSPVDGRSESSSTFDSNSSPVTIILERVTSLLSRMTQADALTLNNRLKRQNLKGADVKHLSRITVGAILSDSAQLRSQFRAYLEDDHVPTSCSRKDLRGLFKLFRECFEEMGQMRVTLNDVILDPSLAPKISEMALDSAKAAERERQAAKGSSWINPLAKLFGTTVTSNATDNSLPVKEAPPMTRALSRGRDTRQRAIVVPKMAPALASTATTVNVDFSSGVARSVTTTHSQKFRPDEMRRTVSSTTSPPPASQASFMGLFAGAPRPGPPADPWVVLPIPSTRRVNPPTLNYDPSVNATIGRSTMRNTARLSQNVDAVIDVDSPAQDNEDSVSPLLQRTLMRRGLSDSSIHSTFLSQADEPLSPVSTRQEAWPDRAGMLRTLSRTVKTFTSAAGSTLAAASSRTADGEETPISSSPPHSSRISETPEGAKRIVPSSSSSPPGANPHSTSSIAVFIPSLTSWTAAGETLDNSGFTGTPRDLHKNWGGRETRERDF